jgi:hypothetical protein
MAVYNRTGAAQHNQSIPVSNGPVMRSSNIWFSPPSGAYMNLPNARGIRTPGTDQMLVLLAPTPQPGSSNPRTFSGRTRILNTQGQRTIFS